MKKHGVLWCFLPTIICLLLPSLARIGVLGDCIKIEECQQTSNSSSPLRFTDPNPQLQINVQQGKFLTPSMSCQAEGFNQIQWIKDDRISYPFDFTPGSSRCHLSLKDCNQTIQITNTQKEAIGNYTCIVSNDEHTIRRTFKVNVLDEPYIDDPFTISHRNCSDVEVKTGQVVNLFCEFCAGDKAQVTELQWNKLDGDGNLVPITQLSGGENKDGSVYWESSNVYTRDCRESDNLPAAVGKTLIIREVTSDLLGSYVLTANYTLNGDVKAGSITVTLSLARDMIIRITVAVVVSLAAIFFVVTTVMVACYNHHLTLQLYWKNRFGKIEEYDGMEYDAFISFSDSSEDGTFAIAVAQLLLQQNYNIWMRDMHAIPGEALIAEEIVSMKQSRRCILIISPEYPTSSHSQVLTDLAADQTLRKRSRIIPILYRDVTKEHLKQHRRLAEIVRVCPCITWKEMGDGGSSEMPSNNISGWSSSEMPINNISGCGSSEIPSNNISGCGSSEMPSNNISGCGAGQMPSNNISGCGTGEMPSISISGCDTGETPSNKISGCGTGEMPTCSSSNKAGSEDLRTCGNVDHDQSNRRTIDGSGREHDTSQLTGISIDEGIPFDHSNGDMRMIHRDGDEDQLIDENQGEQERKKRKMKKQREKYEKRLLLTMPPKRLVAGPAENTASMVV